MKYLQKQINIVPFITGKLFLKVNLQKTTVSHISKVKYLGYGFYRHKGKCRLRVHPKSEAKMKDRLRELTVRGTSGAILKEKRNSTGSNGEGYVRGKNAPGVTTARVESA